MSARTTVECAEALPLVLEHVARDGLIAYPTETVYGFGGAITAPATAALRALKRRDAARPFLLLVSGPDQAPGVHWTDASRAVAQRFWPGPLTIVLAAEQDAFPAGIRSEDGTVALRASSHPFVQALTRAWRAPITSTSANAPGHAPARDCAGVTAALEALGAEDVLVVDGGPLPPSAPSTIVAIEDHSVHILRAGAIDARNMMNELAGIGIHVR